MAHSPLEQAAVIPESDEHHVYRDLERVLAAPAVRLVGTEGEEVRIPPKLHRLMRTFAHALATNEAAMVATTRKDLTTQQAADLLGISRPSLVRLLEVTHAIPFTTIGKHRRINIADLLAYREREYRRQRQAMTDLTRTGEELGGYEIDEEETSPAAAD